MEPSLPLSGVLMVATGCTVHSSSLAKAAAVPAEKFLLLATLRGIRVVENTSQLVHDARQLDLEAHCIVVLLSADLFFLVLEHSASLSRLIV
jgi:hypothetical protein